MPNKVLTDDATRLWAYVPASRFISYILCSVFDLPGHRRRIRCLCQGTFGRYRVLVGIVLNQGPETKRLSPVSEFRV